MSSTTDPQTRPTLPNASAPANAPAFTFVENGSLASIRYQDQPILTFEKNNVFRGTQFFARDQCMVPGQGPELASLPLFSAYTGRHGVCDVRYQATSQPNRLTLKITPTRTLGPHNHLDDIREIRNIAVTLADGRFLWTQSLDVTFLKDLDTRPFGPDTSIRFYRMPHQDGRPGTFMEFCDPQPTGASGPAVPMTHDWLDHHEPYVGQDTFRRHWQRRYVSVMFQDPDGSFAWSELNKRKWFFLTQDNRRARPCHRRGLLYVLRHDGAALEYRANAPSHYHHVCEWGMDFHFWCDLDPYMNNGVIPAGTTIAASTTTRLVGPDVTGPLLQKARHLQLTVQERDLADRPAYEEPQNHFTTSVLDRLDACWWEPTSDGCRWDPVGGRDGRGCLIIENRYARRAQWQVHGIGPSQWCNPLVPHARYRLSAWVRIDALTDPTPTPGPQLGVEFQHYLGPGTVAPKTIVDAGWSPPLIANNKPLPRRLDWTYIQLITPPCPAYVLNVTLKLCLPCHGIARFSDVAWALLNTADTRTNPVK